MVEVKFLKVRLVYKKEPHVIFIHKCPLPNPFSIPNLKNPDSPPTRFDYSFSVLSGGNSDEILEVVYIQR